MLPSAIARVSALPDDAVVLDVGGWASPLARADAVVDLMPYETRGLYGKPDTPERFTAASWHVLDICGHEPWPFPDDAFDFVVCSQTLEDVRDPLRVCAELSRIGKAGYVEVPSAREELTWGVQGPWVGWSHHRWICEVDGTVPGGEVVFSHKPHLLPEPGRHLAAGSLAGLPPEDLVLEHWWTGTLSAREQIFWGAEEFDRWLADLLASNGGATGAAAAGKRTLSRRLRNR